MKQFIKLSLTCLFMIMTFNIQSQEIPSMLDDEILETYWKYRNNLRNNFLKIGSDDGESIPASARRIGTGVEETGPDQPSSMWWGDGTITLSNYIMVLATEYKLLSNAGESTDATLV